MKANISALLILAAFGCGANAAPIATSFTYQGNLTDSGKPTTGIYDLRFTLFDAASGGSAVFAPTTIGEVGVINGLFTVQLDFGDDAFSEGARWLEIAVRETGDTNAFAALAPLQPMTPAPLANYAMSAGIATSALSAQTADSAASAGSVAWANISGKPADFADGVDNDTTYAPGVGLQLNGANVFAVKFAGSGVSNYVARSDHQHFSQVWNGSTTGAGLSLLNSAASGRGVYAKQGGGSGYMSLLAFGAGLWGDTQNDYGVLGTSANGTGVYGIATGTSGTTCGVQGRSGASTGRGVAGFATANNGETVGVYGSSASGAGYGVYGVSTNIGVCGTGYGGVSAHGSYFGVEAFGDSYGVFARSTEGVPLWASGGPDSTVLFRVSQGWGIAQESRCYISGTGHVYASGAFHPGGADFAEMLPAVEGLTPGEVLVIGKEGKVARSTRPHQATLVGVYATKPGLLGGAEDGANLSGKVPVAIVGVVPVKVCSENGPIWPGDKLTSSSVCGHAMKADESPSVGTVIGKALEPFTAKSGVINMLVVLQ